MNKELAERIVDNAPYGVDLYEDYSGRGMYGEKTTAIKCDDAGDLIAAFAQAVLDDPDNGEQVVQAARQLRFDSLGKGMVAY